MSHTIQQTTVQVTPCTLTIVNYATGGETVSPSEFGGAASVNGVVLGTIPPGNNSLGVSLFPLLVAGKIKLLQFTAGAFSEIATINALNAVVVGFIFG